MFLKSIIALSIDLVKNSINFWHTFAALTVNPSQCETDVCNVISQYATNDLISKGILTTLKSFHLHLMVFFSEWSWFRCHQVIALVLHYHSLPGEPRSRLLE